MQSTSIRVDRPTHDDIKRIATLLGWTVGDTVRHAIRRLMQERIGTDLANALTEEETEWLDADLG